MSSYPFDYQVSGYTLPVGSSICAQCRMPATVRLGVNRVERSGQLVRDSQTDYCDDHIEEATKAARATCQARLYGHKGAA